MLNHLRLFPWFRLWPGCGDSIKLIIPLIIRHYSFDNSCQFPDYSFQFQWFLWLGCSKSLWIEAGERQDPLQCRCHRCWPGPLTLLRPASSPSHPRPGAAGQPGTSLTGSGPRSQRRRQPLIQLLRGLCLPEPPLPLLRHSSLQETPGRYGTATVILFTAPSTVQSPLPACVAGTAPAGAAKAMALSYGEACTVQHGVAYKEDSLSTVISWKRSSSAANFFCADTANEGWNSSSLLPVWKAYKMVSVSEHLGYPEPVPTGTSSGSENEPSAGIEASQAAEDTGCCTSPISARATMSSKLSQREKLDCKKPRILKIENFNINY